MAAESASIARGAVVVASLAAVTVAVVVLVDASEGESPLGEAEACCEAPVEVWDEGRERVGCADEPALSPCGKLEAGDRVDLDEGACRRTREGMKAVLRLHHRLGLDANRASIADLQLIRGIGPQLAAAIAAERERQPFKRIEDLLRVHGIGEKTLEELRGDLTVVARGETEQASEDGR